MNDGVNSVTLFKVLDSLLTPHSLLIGEFPPLLAESAPNSTLRKVAPGAVDFPQSCMRQTHTV